MVDLLALNIPARFIDDRFANTDREILALPLELRFAEALLVDSNEMTRP